MRKYRNTPVTADGKRFDSKREYARYVQLKNLQMGGEIENLEVHPRFPFVVGGMNVGYYEADFRYLDRRTGETVVEDAKSPSTRKEPYYRLKNRLMQALYGIQVVEV